MNAQEEIKFYGNKVAGIVSKIAKAYKADADDAKNIALMLVFANKGFWSDSESADLTKRLVHRLPYNVALDIIDRQNKSAKLYGEKVYAMSEKQIAVIENFIAVLETELKSVELLASFGTFDNVKSPAQIREEDDARITANNAAAAQRTPEEIEDDAIVNEIRAQGSVGDDAKMTGRNSITIGGVTVPAPLMSEAARAVFAYRFCVQDSVLVAKEEARKATRKSQMEWHDIIKQIWKWFHVASETEMEARWHSQLSAIAAGESGWARMVREFEKRADIFEEPARVWSRNNPADFRTPEYKDNA